MKKKRTVSLFASMVVGALMTLCGLFGAIGENGQAKTESSQKSSVVPPAQESAMICPMEWLSPDTSNSVEFPHYGKAVFDWTDHPEAGDYAMTLVMPNGSLVDYDVDGSTKDLFLSNYDQAGDYLVTVTALSADNAPLCSIVMNFHMGEVPVEVQNDGEENPPAAVNPVPTVEIR